jgi:hypothetical protein
MNLSEITQKYDKNEHGLFEEYFEKINNDINKNILSELQLNKKEMKNILTKLKKYKYVEEVDDLKYGSFIRWIDLIDPENLVLRNSCMICEVKFTDNGTIILCKNFMNRYYSIKMDECLIFQKITNEEQIIIEMIEENI